MAPTARVGAGRFELSSALNSARNRLTHAGASARVLRKYTALKREWSSTRTSRYLWPLLVGTKGPATSAGAGVARAIGSAAERGRRVGGDVRQGAEALVPSVQPSVHVLGGLLGGHGVDVGSGFRRSNIHRSGWRAGRGVNTRRAYLCAKLVEATVSVQAKCVLKGRSASYVAQDEGARGAVHVGGEKVELANGGALPRLLVDTHDVFTAWLGVDQIGRKRVYVPRASTVDDQGQTVVGVAAPFQPVVPAGEEGVRGRGGSRAFDVPARPPGRAIIVTWCGGGTAAADDEAREGRDETRCEERRRHVWQTGRRRRAPCEQSGREEGRADRRVADARRGETQAMVAAREGG
eukprot:6213051-Pleurochrysis_carterae.AAC.4